MQFGLKLQRDAARVPGTCAVQNQDGVIPCHTVGRQLHLRLPRLLLLRRRRPSVLRRSPGHLGNRG